MAALKEKCDLSMEIQLIVFKCKVCLDGCPFGRYIVDEYESWELERFHRKFETE
jgi:Fe-S-cluster-containing hydrogenase component 2